MSFPKLKKGEQKAFFKAGGEWCYIWTPPGFDPAKSVPVVVHHHGAGGYVKEGASDWLDTPTKTAYLRAVMEGSGGAVAGSHACGDHWGNNCAVEANKALLNALDKVKGLDTGRLGMMGGGLGGALIWNSVLGPDAGRAKAVAVIEKDVSLGSTGGLFMDVSAALANARKSPLMQNFICGLGGRDVTAAQIREAVKSAVEAAKSGKVEESVRWLGLRETMVGLKP